ncbi:BLUF domain-containing protein [Rubrivirga sp. S365]|uniref:BLUF domain-containing protein n=1 Tax=Rubrivirga litoralis TaxID=3075598 RepID=A0ABU3BPF2_9BACT|nr:MULTISPECIES: BLUF domain-containing protein [unclassified Rubrivirga]MDT0631148.1 BLUF domain-containing protein [Rubrivirga sp. F394]MDT7855339.1 BLUF domain-containing protein [Rubrivirga sp. S365]
MSSAPLVQVVYGSATPHLLSRDELLDILRVSRRNNAAAGVTGALLYTEGNVMQVLEGPGPAVEATYARIARDPRHHRVLPLIRGPVEARSFPDWSMGLCDVHGLDDEDRAATRSLLDLTAPGPDRARRLLASFRALLPGVRTHVPG